MSQERATTRPGGKSRRVEPDPHAVERYSILEHTTRRLLLEALAGTPWERPLGAGHQGG